MTWLSFFDSLNQPLATGGFDFDCWLALHSHLTKLANYAIKSLVIALLNPTCCQSKTNLFYNETVLIFDDG